MEIIPFGGLGGDRRPLKVISSAVSAVSARGFGPRRSASFADSAVIVVKFVLEGMPPTPTK